MNKATFLKEAKEKYKTQLEKEWVAEMNFIFSPSLILRVWFDVNFKLNNKFGKNGYMHRWCTVETLPVDNECKFIVSVTRTSYSTRNIEVDATSRKEAEELAIDAAGDYEFSEQNADYSTNSILTEQEHKSLFK